MNAQKKLLTNIAQVEKKIQREQVELVKHKQYFSTLTHKELFVIALLVPAFYIGWREAKIVSFGKGLKQISSFFVSLGFKIIGQKIVQNFHKHVKNIK